MTATCLRQPPRRIRSAPLHRHDTASLGARTIGLTGTGSEHARLLRLVLLSYTRWPGRTGQSPWPSNATLAARTGLDERQVERALAALVAADLVSTRIGRHGARREVGRLIDVGLHTQVKALAPDGVDVRTLWDVARSLRDRPAALVTAMVGAYMLASDAAGGAIDEWSALGCTMADWRRFVGHRDNAACCVRCARNATPAHVPSKKEWCEREAVAMGPGAGFRAEFERDRERWAEAKCWEGYR